MAKSIYASLQEEVLEANLEIAQRGLALYTWGNASGLDLTRGVFAIKPSGVPYGQLAAADIVIVSLEGQVVEGKLRPSSDTPTHAALYRSFADKGLGAKIRGIVHTHSPHACAWAQAARAIPLYGTTHADHSTEDIPCTPFMSDALVREQYELATGLQIIEHLAKRGLDPQENPMILVAGHGPFTWGASPEKAVYHAAVLEELAKIAWMTEQLNPKVKRLKQSIIQKHYERKHGPAAYYGQTTDNA